MPQGNKLIEFESISDVMIELLYTSMNGGDGFRQQVSDLPQMRSRSWSCLLQPATQMQADWYAFMTGPVVKAEQTLILSIPGLSRSHVSGGAVPSLYLPSITSQGCSHLSPHDSVIPHNHP